MKIVIADDDADDRILVSLAFKDLNVSHDVDFVNDGQELIDYLTASKTLDYPDLILLDLNMPGKDGRLALKEIKSNPSFQGLKVVIFSTSTSEEDKNYTMRLGAENYIVKPSGYKELLQVFRNIHEGLV